MLNQVDNIIAYEQGELDGNAMLNPFASLVKTGMVWSLQGSYGRQAAYLIQRGYLTPAGERTFKEEKLDA